MPGVTQITLRLHRNVAAGAVIAKSVTYATRRFQRPPATQNSHPMLRQFTDANGMTWRVWDVWPSIRPGAAGTTRSESYAGAFPAMSFGDGWLCFECDREKRRLSPIPPEWETCEECVLEDLCRKASFSTPTPRDSSAYRDQRADAD